MRTKEQILSSYKKNYKPCFLLAWQRFLTYDELKKLDMLEPYDAALMAKQIKSSKDWDDHVVAYTKQNLLFGLCILMRRLFNKLAKEDIAIASVYANDVEEWLSILDDNEFDIDESLDLKKIIDFYRGVAQKYKIDLL